MPSHAHMTVIVTLCQHCVNKQRFVTYHAYMSVNVVNPLVSSWLIQLGSDQFFNTKYHAIFTSETNSSTAVLHCFDGVFYLEHPTIGWELRCWQVILKRNNSFWLTSVSKFLQNLLICLQVHNFVHVQMKKSTFLQLAENCHVMYWLALLSPEIYNHFNAIHPNKDC